MSLDWIETAAAELRTAQETGVPVPPLLGRYPFEGLDSAYRVQQANVRHGLAAGRRLVGCKIGLTAKVVQAQLGVDHPDIGVLFADMVFGDNEEIPAHLLLQPKAEAEIAFVLSRDLDQERLSLVDVMRAVEFVAPAVEIVSSRIADWKIALVDTVADNASSAAVVLGGPVRRLDGLDLKDCRMTLARGEEVVSTGIGSACLGHPLNAVLWLARVRVQLGDPLRAGDLVMSGALGPMAAIDAGQAMRATIEGLGSVDVRIGTS